MLDCSTVCQELSTGSQSASPAGDAQSRRPHVLIVDDDPTNRRVLQGMLTQLGYACSTVDDGAKAVAAVGDGHFDAVLMDCLMPVMDGYDATRAIRGREVAHAGATPSHVPVIAVTALAMQGARERCLGAGMDDYLTKPVMLESLERVLGRWVGTRQAADAWSVVTDAPAPQEDGPIDAQMLDELMALGEDAGRALIAELVSDFGTEVSARFPLMQAALAARDIPALLHELHFVAGCASIVGARHVEQLARSVTASNAPTSVGAAATLVGQLEDAYDTAFACLNDMVASPRP